MCTFQTLGVSFTITFYRNRNVLKCVHVLETLYTHASPYIQLHVILEESVVCKQINESGKVCVYVCEKEKEIDMKIFVL